MNDIYIVGASGFGREVAWLIEELETWNIAGFIDDNESIQNTIINNIPVIGNTDFLLDMKDNINVVIAIGNPYIREKIVQKLISKETICFPNIIAKDVRISKYVKMGIGNIICTGTILTTNISLGNFNHINLDCTVGHDVVLNDYITVYPSVNISGNVNIDDYSELGTGSKIIQGKTLAKSVVLGAGAVVVKNLEESGTYVGVPTKKTN
ncbi:NeuD/PglB/VioB family sugar acetyltransferase [Longibaculum muris]|uniref:NeuD/PglB/VioB family sugar acetyltransferase n=1 Tax=Longibaculum muris TaxID=1796628 RepID=UPI0022E7EF20|nr:NeuD/PglB/VioB family sugar acetyltransferase [Longibaculum muris]